MTPDEMRSRTQDFALRIIRLTRTLPRDAAAQVLARQLLRSGSSVGANYRAACRSRSDGDFLARMGIVEEEADESRYWMELLVRAGLVKSKLLEPLMQEADQLVAMTVASVNTVKRRLRNARKPSRGSAVAESEIPNPKSQVIASVVESEIRNPKSEMHARG